jgi:hypothetical protein
MIRTRRQLVEVSQATCSRENAAVDDAALLHVMPPSSCSSSSSVTVDGIILPLANSLPSPVPSRPKGDLLVQADPSLPYQALTSRQRLRQLPSPPRHPQFSPLPLPVHLHHLKVTTHVPLFLPSWQFHPVSLSQSIALHPEFSEEMQVPVPPVNRASFSLHTLQPLSLRMPTYVLFPHFILPSCSSSRVLSTSAAACPYPPRRQSKSVSHIFPTKCFSCRSSYFALQAVLDLACNWVRLLLICRDLKPQHDVR